MIDWSLSPDSSALDIALGFSEYGFKVIPVTRAEKRPTVAWKKYQEEIVPDDHEIRLWFTNANGVMPALICGDFVVVDADTPEAVGWCIKNLTFTPFRVTTGRGVHFYYCNRIGFGRYTARRGQVEPEKEIDIILDAYKNENMSKETRFLMIEDTINYNFAGTGIAKFVAGI